MFELSHIKLLTESQKDGLVTTPDKKYALYKFDRGDKIEIRMEETYTRPVNNTIRYSETILRFYLQKEEELFQVLYTMLRNCLLVERVK